MALQISYKFWYVSRDDDSGLITEAAVRFYEGEDMEVQERDALTQETKAVTRYVRTKRLEPKDVPELDASHGMKAELAKAMESGIGEEEKAKLAKVEIPVGVSFRKEADGSYARVYTPSDFGQIKTDDELRLFVNKEMLKHEARPNQPAQAEVDDVTKVV